MTRITGISQSLWANRTLTAVVGSDTVTLTERYQTPLNWEVKYDSRHRVAEFNRAGSETSYSYDANSNRLTTVDKITSDTDLNGDFSEADFSLTTAQAVNFERSNNRLTGFVKTIIKEKGRPPEGSGGPLLLRLAVNKPASILNVPVTYTLDAAGNLTSDGLRDFEYDEANRLSKVKLFKDGEAAKVPTSPTPWANASSKASPRPSKPCPMKPSWVWTSSPGSKATSSGCLPPPRPTRALARGTRMPMGNCQLGPCWVNTTMDQPQARAEPNTCGCPQTMAVQYREASSETASSSPSTQTIWARPG